jgi:hypothetical protein
MKKVLYLLILFIWFHALLYPQSLSLIHVPVREYSGDDALYFECLFTGDFATLTSVTLYARPVGNRGYQQYPMHFNGLEWVGRIPHKDLRTDDMEYFIMAETQYDGVISVPDKDPFDAPFRIIYTGTEDRERRPADVSGETGTLKADYLILSPEPGSTVEKEDFVIALSLFNVPDIDLESVQIEINGINRTVYAEKSPEIITLTLPKELLQTGIYNVTIRASDHYGIAFRTETWTFTVTGKTEARRRISRTFNGQLSSEFRYEEAEGIQNNLFRFTGRMNGNIQGIDVGASGMWVSNDSKQHQPRNVANAFIRSPYADLELGTFYPEISRLTLFGNRVHGGLFRLKLKFFDLTYLQGRLLREIDGRAQRDTISREWSITSYTFARQVQIIQPAFHLGEQLSLKFTAMHARDDTASLDPAITIENFNPDTDTYSFKSSTPVDNLVFDTNLSLNLDNYRFVWTHNLALSMTNRNIFGGAADSIILGNETVNIAEQLPSFMSPEKISYFFIINKNSTLPIPAELNEDLTGFTMYPLKISEYPSLAYRTSLRLNYYNNLITWTFRHIAPEFTSLAYPGFQNDIHVSEISDRIRLFRNRLIISLLYSNQYDNLLKQKKEYVTTTNTVSAGLSVLPGPELPTVTVSFRYFLRENDLNTPADTLSEILQSAAMDQRIRNENLYQLFSLTQPFTMGDIPTDFALNYIRTLREDKIPDRPADYRSPDYSMNLWSLSGTTRWSSTLIQVVSWTFMQNEMGNSSQYTYQTFSGKLEESFWQDKIFGALEIKWTHTSGDVSFNQYLMTPELRIKLFENDLIINVHFNKLDQKGTSRITRRFYTKYSYNF